MLVQLPLEILEHIFLYCDVEDKHNVALCSKELNTIMEPLLWNTVYIRSDLLNATWQKDLLRKFRHTRSLDMHFGKNYEIFFSSHHTKQSSTSPAANFNLTRVLGAIDRNQLTKFSVSYLNCDDIFKYIMDTLWFVERIDLVGVQLTEKAWKSLPSGLRRLSFGRLCNVTDGIIKEIMERCQLKKLECDLDFFDRTGISDKLSNESLHHISKVESIEDLSIFLCIPPTVDITCLSKMHNLTSLNLSGNIPLLDAKNFMFQICQNLQRLEVLVLSSVRVTDESFCNIHMLSSLVKLSILTMDCLSACSIFHYLKLISTLQELEFDGWTFKELALDKEMMKDERKEELYKDIRVLNHLKKLSKITVSCFDEYDISQIIIEGLCERRKWIHQYGNYVHTFYNAFCRPRQ